MINPKLDPIVYALRYNAERKAEQENREYVKVRNSLTLIAKMIDLIKYNAKPNSSEYVNQP